MYDVCGNVNKFILNLRCSSDGQKKKNLLAMVQPPRKIPGSGRSPEEGNGIPLQYSCLRNPLDRGAWWATVHKVTNSWTWLSTHTYTGRKRQHEWRVYIPHLRLYLKGNRDPNDGFRGVKWSDLFIVITLLTWSRISYKGIRVLEVRTL